MQSTTKSSTTTSTTPSSLSVSSTTSLPYYQSKHRHDSSSFFSKFPSVFGSSSNSTSQKYWNSHWNTTLGKPSSSFKSWSSQNGRSSSSSGHVPATSESAPPPSRTTSSAESRDYLGVTKSPFSNSPPHNHVYQPAVHGAFSSTFNDNDYDSGLNSNSTDDGLYTNNGYNSTSKRRHLGLGILPIVIQIDTKAMQEEQELEREQALRSGRGSSNLGSGFSKPIRGTGGLNLKHILQQLDSESYNGNKMSLKSHQNTDNFNSNRHYQGSASSWNPSTNLENSGNYNGFTGKATISVEKPYSGPISNNDQIDDSQWPGKVEFISSPFAKKNPHSNREHYYQQNNHHQQQNFHHQGNFNSELGNNNAQNHYHNHHLNNHNYPPQHWNNDHYQFHPYNHRQPFHTDFMTSASSSSGSSDGYNNRPRPRGRGCQRQQTPKKRPCSGKKSSSSLHNSFLSSVNLQPSASNIDFDDVFFSRLPGFVDSAAFFNRKPSSPSSLGPLGRHIAKSRRQKALQKSILQGLPSSIVNSWTSPLPSSSAQAVHNFYNDLFSSSGLATDFAGSSALPSNEYPTFALPMDGSGVPGVFSPNQLPVMLPPPPPPPAVIAAQLAVAAAASGQLPPLPQQTLNPKKDSTSTGTSEVVSKPETTPQKASTSSRFRFWSPFAAAISRTDKLAKQSLTLIKGKSKIAAKSAPKSASPSGVASSSPSLISKAP